jgi:hypothetical protein
MEKIDLIKLLRAISKQKWTFAKTYSKIAPHEYIIAKQNWYIYNAIKWLIQYYGFWQKITIGTTVREYRYFVLGKYRYWVMGYILNRTKFNEKNEVNIITK